VIGRASWVAEVRSFDGVPYHHQGRSRAGIDCPAPLILPARKFGIVAPDFDFTAYPRDPDGSLQPMLDAHLVRKPRDALGLGDVVLSAFRMRPPQHIAIIVGEGYGEWELLHASARVGKAVIERIQYGRYYRFVQGYGVPGVE
jgi:cell wall-associated NlpC family hydrolase